MKVTPLDIRRREFKRAMRGYSEEDVDIFLDDVADEFERMFKENSDLRERLQATEEKVSGNVQLKNALEKTLVQAQWQAEQLTSNAQKESELLLRDAGFQASQLVNNAYLETQKMQQNLEQLKQLDEDFRYKLRSMLEGYLKILDDTSLAFVANSAEKANEEITTESILAGQANEISKDTNEMRLEADQVSEVTVETDNSFDEPTRTMTSFAVEAPSAFPATNDAPPTIDDFASITESTNEVLAYPSPFAQEYTSSPIVIPEPSFDPTPQINAVPPYEPSPYITAVPPFEPLPQINSAPMTETSPQVAAVPPVPNYAASVPVDTMPFSPNITPTLNPISAAFESVPSFDSSISKLDSNLPKAPDIPVSIMAPILPIEDHSQKGMTLLPITETSSPHLGESTIENIMNESTLETPVVRSPDLADETTAEITKGFYFGKQELDDDSFMLRKSLPKDEDRGFEW